METIFAVGNEHLARLTPEQSVDFFRELLWAEATALGIGKNLINVPSAITVADGGIDAEVKDVPAEGGQGIIKQGLTRYQIKTGGFSLSREGDIKAILFSEGNHALKPKIKSCLDRNGTFVIVLFGCDNPEAQEDQSINRIKAVLERFDSNYGGARIEIWRQNNIRGFLTLYPSLALKVTGRDKGKFQSHKSWSQNDDMRNELRIGEVQSRVISGLQSELRRNDKTVHVRVWGEPGIGKTKLVLEAVRAEDLQPQVVYYDSASQFRDSELMYEMLKEDNQFSVILVLDECDPDSRSYIWNRLKHCGPRIKIVSIYNEYDPTTGDISYFDIPPLTEESISKIIQGYSIEKYQADRHSEYCGGSPRVAHVVGKNLRENPEDIFRPLDTVINVWERYIIGSDNRSDPKVEQRRLVLYYISLFKRFGWKKPYIKEAAAISELVRRHENQITQQVFDGIVTELKNRKILQGETTLYITPKLLHIWLWKEYWERYGNSFDYQNFSKNLPENLLGWFHEMFKYATASEVASGVVRGLLGEGGPFSDSSFLKTKIGADFFLALTEAEPKAALQYLNRTVGTWDKEALLEFTTGRREVVWALERTAIWRELFSDSAKLLLALGEAETEEYANNASGVFAGLFANGSGHVASTEASPEERFPVLLEAFQSASKEKRVLALKACEEALSLHFTRTVGAEYQGLKQEPNLWMPKTYGEWYDAYRRVWKLLSEGVDNLPEDEQQKAVNILINHSMGMLGISNLAQMAIVTLEELSQKEYVEKKDILSEIGRILHYQIKEILPEIKERLEELRDSLIGTDFSSHMKRYVGMETLEDYYDEDGSRVDKNLPKIQELVAQVIEGPKLLEPELGWLLTSTCANSYRFGYELGSRDKEFTLLPHLLEAQRGAKDKVTVLFLGGYFRCLFEKESEKWEKELDSLLKDEKLRFWIPELTWQSGMSDKAADRILFLAEKGLIDISHFQRFIYGRSIQNLSESRFLKWISFLLGSNSPSAVSVALNLYNAYYYRIETRKSLPEELTLSLLTHLSLVCGKYEMHQLDEHCWAEIAKVFIELYPEKSIELASIMLEHFGEDGTIFESHFSQTQEVLNRITSSHPSEVWDIAVKYLGPPIDSRAFQITHWLRGGSYFKSGEEGILPLIPLKKIWEWVNGDVGKRAWYLATFVPNRLFREEGIVCMAREVLVRYGYRKDVRNNLRANFSTEGFSGPASLHYREKKEELLNYKKEESDKNVIGWIDEYVSILESRIEKEKQDEEREF